MNAAQLGDPLESSALATSGINLLCSRHEQHDHTKRQSTQEYGNRNKALKHQVLAAAQLGDPLELSVYPSPGTNLLRSRHETALANLPATEIAKIPTAPHNR
jgi:hypothetical protein